MLKGEGASAGRAVPVGGGAGCGGGVRGADGGVRADGAPVEGAREEER